MTLPRPPGDSAAITHRLRGSGLAGALLLGASSLSPSFIPRTWWMTAFNFGICLFYGYALGCLVGVLVRWFARVTGLEVSLRADAARLLRRLIGVAVALGALEVMRRSTLWQLDVSRRVGSDPVPVVDQLIGILGGISLFVALLLLFRALRGLWRLLRRISRPYVPSIVSTVVSLVIVVWLVVFVSNDVLFAGFLESATRNAAAVNAETPPGRTPPQEGTRSGSPHSPETWASLGRQGQGVVADGPRRARIEEVTGRPAKEPIRVYAGLHDGRSLEATADAVVAELHRTRAFDRSVLVVMIPAGEGWIPDWHPSSVEFLTGGDSAIASMQYTYLPSALAYLTDKEGAAEAGTVLFDKVEAEVRRRPVGHRPRLYIGGESMGAYGGQAVFAGKDDLLSRVDGAMWTGTPRSSTLWRSLTASRWEGSPEIAPVVDGGRHIRFITERQNSVNDFYGRPLGPWESPRIAFAQNPNDPVVWWSSDLMWEEPDWMRERASTKVTPGMTWAPWVTFWQIAADMPRSVRVPGGEGHRYQEGLVPLWAGVLGLDPMADYSRIQKAMREDYRVF